MRTIIIPVILLISAVLFVCWSGYSVQNSLNELIDQTTRLPEEPAEGTVEEIKAIEEHWNRHKEIYSAVIKFDFVYNFSKELSAAKAGAAADDPGTYLAAKKSMLNILEYIEDVQRLRWDNII